MQQESTSPPSRLQTVDDPPTFGCSMLTRIRQLPWGLEDRPIARCSLGFALHDDDEVAQCRGVEGPAACWKAAANWRVAPAPGPGPRGERPDMSAHQPDSLAAAASASSVPAAAAPTATTAEAANAQQLDDQQDGADGQETRQSSRRGDRRQRAAARAAARAQERADAAAAANASNADDAASQESPEDAVGSDTAADTSVAAMTSEQIADAALTGELQVLSEDGAEPVMSEVLNEADGTPAQNVVTNIPDATAQHDEWASAEATAAVRATEALQADDDAPSAAAMAVESATEAPSDADRELVTAEQEREGDLPAPAAALSATVADVPEVREAAALTAMEASDFDVAHVPKPVLLVEHIDDELDEPDPSPSLIDDAADDMAQHSSSNDGAQPLPEAFTGAVAGEAASLGAVDADVTTPEATAETADADAPRHDALPLEPAPASDADVDADADAADDQPKRNLP